MRKLLVLLVVLAALAVAADLGSRALAERAIADQLRRTADLSATPRVELGGFPFLTQVLSGRYDDVRVQAQGVQQAGVRVEELDARLTGVRVKLGEALGGDLTALPVGGLTATARITYADLARRTGLKGVSVTPEGERIRVTATVTVLGRSFTGSAVSSLLLRDGVLSFAARTATVAGASARVARVVAERLRFLVPVGDLPFGLRLDGVEVTRDGLRLTASSGPTVLRVS